MSDWQCVVCLDSILHCVYKQCMCGLCNNAFLLSACVCRWFRDTHKFVLRSLLASSRKRIPIAPACCSWEFKDVTAWCKTVSENCNMPSSCSANDLSRLRISNAIMCVDNPWIGFKGGQGIDFLYIMEPAVRAGDTYIRSLSDHLMEKQVFVFPWKREFYLQHFDNREEDLKTPAQQAFVERLKVLMEA